LCTKCRFSWALQFVKNNANFCRLEEDKKKGGRLEKSRGSKGTRLLTGPEDMDSDDA